MSKEYDWGVFQQTALRAGNETSWIARYTVMQLCFILTIVTIIVCGVPGILFSLRGILIAGFDPLVDKAQLKLDTDLDQTSMTLTGLGDLSRPYFGRYFHSDLVTDQVL